MIVPSRIAAVALVSVALGLAVVSAVARTPLVRKTTNQKRGVTIGGPPDTAVRPPRPPPRPARPYTLSPRRARRLYTAYQNGEADGLSLMIYKREGNRPIPAAPHLAFRHGDEIRIEFGTNFDGYVYFVNVTPGGQRRVLFPFPDETDNSIRAARRYQLPRAGWLQFDDEKGVERLQVVISRTRIPLLDESARNPQGEIREPAASGAPGLPGSNLRPAPAPPRPGIVVESPDQALVPDKGGTRRRGLTVVPGRKGELIVMPEAGGRAERIKAGEVSLFEIHLQHN